MYERILGGLNRTENSMNESRSGNAFRFPLALLVGVAAGFFANSLVSNGAFFVGGTALGTMAALWLFGWVDRSLGSRSGESPGQDEPPR